MTSFLSSIQPGGAEKDLGIGELTDFEKEKLDEVLNYILFIQNYLYRFIC